MRKARAEFVTPTPDRFAAEDNAELEQQFFELRRLS